MAQRMGRAPSSISREIARHGGQGGGYRALAADRQAWRNAQRPTVCRLAQQPALAPLVAQKWRMALKSIYAQRLQDLQDMIDFNAAAEANNPQLRAAIERLAQSSPHGPTGRNSR